MPYGPSYYGAAIPKPRYGNSTSATCLFLLPSVVPLRKFYPDQGEIAKGQRAGFVVFNPCDSHCRTLETFPFIGSPPDAVHTPRKLDGSATSLTVQVCTTVLLTSSMFPCRPCRLLFPYQDSYDDHLSQSPMHNHCEHGLD